MCTPIASHATPLVQTLTADKPLAVTVVQFVTASIVAAITFKTEAIPATQATITSQTVKIPASKDMVFCKWSNRLKIKFNEAYIYLVLQIMHTSICLYKHVPCYLLDTGSLMLNTVFELQMLLDLCHVISCHKMWPALTLSVQGK